MDPQVVKALAPYKAAVNAHLVPDLSNLVAGYLVDLGRQDGLTGTLVNDVKQGVWSGIDTKTEIPYVSDKRHGTCRGWYENGQLRYEYAFVDGKRHGTSPRWYENGQLMHEY